MIAILFFLAAVFFFVWATVSGKRLLADINRTHPDVYQQHIANTGKVHFHWVILIGGAAVDRSGFSTQILTSLVRVKRLYLASLLCLLMFALMLVLEGAAG